MRRLQFVKVILALILVCLLALLVASHGRAREKFKHETQDVASVESVVSTFDDVLPLLFAGAAEDRVAGRDAFAPDKGGRGKGPPRPAARRPAAPQNIVVDTLNLTHWLGRGAARGRVEQADIIAAIDTTAPALHRRYPGRVIYVTKDRETRGDAETAEKTRAAYHEAARRNSVYIHVVERLPDDAPRGRSAPHAALGRDDFYITLLAWKLRAPVLSRDRFRDLADMKRGQLDKFHVYSFSPFRVAPARDYVNPAAAEFARMRPPTTVDYSEVLEGL